MSSDRYTPHITRTLTSTGRKVRFTAAELDELIERIYDFTGEARHTQLQARLTYAKPTKHNLTPATINSPHGETLTFYSGEALGVWPYGSPILVFESPNMPTYPLSIDGDGTDDEERWRLTLSNATGISCGTAHWRDTAGIHALFDRLHTTTAEQLATQMVLSTSDVRWPSAPLDGVVEAIDTILETTKDLEPVDLETTQTQLATIDPDLHIHPLRLLDPRIMRYVTVPAVAHINQPWSYLTADIDAVLKKISLAPIRRTGRSNKTAFLFEHRLATARPQPAALRSVPATLTPFLSPQPGSDDDPLDAGWFTAAARPINTTPLTHAEHAGLLERTTSTAR